MNRIASLLFTIILVSCQTYEVVETAEELESLWFDKATMEWVLKIESNIVFWVNKIEVIEKIERSENDFKITTSTQTIYATLSNDSVFIDGRWLTRYFKDDLLVPRDNEQIIQRGTAVIQGFIDEIDSLSQGLPFKVYVNDFVLGDQLEYLTEVDSNGVFRLEIEINGTQDIILGYEYFDHWRKLLVSPGDTLTINVPRSGSSENIHFAGNNSSANYDIFYMNELYQSFVPDYITRNRALGYEPDEYLQFRRDYRQSDHRFLDEYCNQNNCTELFQQWFISNSEVEYFSNLMKFSWQSLNYGLGSEKRLIGDLKEQYEQQFMDSINQDSKLYHLSSSYFGLINGISHRVVNYSQETNKKYRQAEIDFLLNNEVLLSNKDREFLLGFKDNGINPKELNEEEKEVWWAIEDRVGNSLMTFRMKSGFEYHMDELSNAENDYTKELLLTQHFYRSILLDRNYEIMDWAFEKTSSQIRNESYVQYLKTLHEEIKSQEAKTELLDLTAIKFDGSGNTLLKKIQKDNVGQSIVIDFWGTWCQPCLKDFEVSEEIKSDLSHVKFIYFCVYSAERNWKNALIKYNPQGDHYLLSPRQTEELLEMFEVKSFPTYLLIDKKGNVHREIPRVTNREEFLKYLEGIG
ncbi:MAG: thioredoxin family protein [Cytophagales bacterium]|nr:thioredoxin family protein [Cytophagales bacterium]